MSLSDQNRALIEREFSPRTALRASGSEGGAIFSSLTLNQLLDAARAEGRSSPEPQAVARTGVVHDLKTWPEPFAAVRAGLKPWELRLDDRDFRVGDVLRLREWIPALDAYTGEVEERVVIWKLDGGQFGLPVGYAILSLAALSTPSPEAEREEDLRAEVLAIFKANKMATDERLAILIAERLSSRLSPPAPEPEDPIGDYQLHPKTAALVRRFMSAVAAKLAAAEVKYGYSDGWADPAWQDECRRQLYHHAAKGDPRDVAAYAAFCWHHGWSTAAPEPGYEAEPVAIKTVGWAALASNGNIRFWLRDREPVQEFANLYGCDVVRLVASPVPVAIERLAEELVAAEEQGRPFLLLKTDEVRAILQRLSNQQGGGKGPIPELPGVSAVQLPASSAAQHSDGGASPSDGSAA